MAERFETRISVARAELEAAKQLLHSDIAEYPGPIAWCDAQFNYMLAERQKVLLALRALNEDVFIPTPRSPDDANTVETR